MSWRRSEDQPNSEILGEAIEILPGWSRILVNLDRLILTVDPRYKIGQIKEKFGGLRYYIRTSETYQRDIKPDFPMFIDPVSIFIAWAEHQSFTTCEDCGKSNSFEAVVTTETVGDDGYWILTLCMDCRQKRIKAKRIQDRVKEDKPILDLLD